MKVREEIEKHAAEADKPILLWLFERYHMESEWRFVARCHLGVGREWVPSSAGRLLYSAAHPPLPAIFAWPENQGCLGCKHSFWRRGDNLTQDSMCALGVDDLINDCEKREPDDEYDG